MSKSGVNNSEQEIFRTFAITFNAKYTVELRAKFDPIHALVSSGKKADAGVLFKALSLPEQKLCQEYTKDQRKLLELKESSDAQLQREKARVEDEITALKQQREAMLYQHGNAMAQNLRPYTGQTTQSSVVDRREGFVLK